MQGSLDNPEGERAALEKAVEVQPNDVDAWLRLAQFLDGHKAARETLAAYRRLAELLPDDPYIGNNLAYCLLESGGDAEEALERARKASERLGLNSHVAHTLGLAQMRCGDLEEGAKNLAVALEMRPGDPTLLLDYGQLLIAQKRLEEGKNYLQLALRYTDQLGLDFPRRAEAESALVGG